MEINETLGQKIVRLREEKGLSRKDLAKKSGITGANLKNIELDKVKTRLRPLTIFRLAEALEVEYEYLEQ